jgi:hypothetical protein
MSEIGYYCTTLDGACHYYEAIIVSDKISDIKIITTYNNILDFNDIKTKKLIGTDRFDLYLCIYSSEKNISKKLDHEETIFVKSKLSSLYINEYNTYKSSINQLNNAITNAQNKINSELYEKKVQNRNQKLKQFVKKFTKIDIDNFNKHNSTSAENNKQKNFTFSK